MSKDLYIKQLEDSNEQLMNKVARLEELVYKLDRPNFKIEPVETISPDYFIEPKRYYHILTKISQEKIDDLCYGGTDFNGVATIILEQLKEEMKKTIKVTRR